MKKSNKILYISIASIATLSIIGSGFATWYFIVASENNIIENVSLQVANKLSIDSLSVEASFPQYLSIEDPSEEDIHSYEELDKNGLYNGARSGLVFFKESEANGIKDTNGSSVSLLTSIDSEFSFTITDDKTTDDNFLFNKSFNEDEYCEIFLGAEVLINGTANYDYFTIASGTDYDYKYDASTKTYGRLLNDLVSGWTNTDGQTISYSADVRSIISLSDDLKNAFAQYNDSDSAKSFLKTAFTDLSEYGYDSTTSSTVSLNKVEIKLYLTITTNLLH